MKPGDLVKIMRHPTIEPETYGVVRGTGTGYKSHWLLIFVDSKNTHWVPRDEVDLVESAADAVRGG